MRRGGRTIAAAALVLAASAAGAAEPMTVSLLRGGDDRLTNTLVDAVRAAAPAANVSFARVGTPDAIPVEFGVPRPYGRHHFLMIVSSPYWKIGKPMRFHDIRVHCDKRRDDICAGQILATLDRHFRRRA